ncbi:hypothetical protein ES703_107553 [subsurface metagenome]
MRRDVVDDLHAGGLQLRHGIGCRRFNQVHLPCEQRIGAGQRFRHRDQDHLVDFGKALLVPIVGVLRELGELARHQFCQFERPGAGGFLRKLVPILAELFILRRAGDQEPEHLVGEEGIDGLGGDFDRAVVDLGVAGDRRQAGLDLRALPFVELRRLVVQHLVEIPDHRVRIELAAVVEFHALAQGKAPLGLVGIVHLPFGGKPGHQLARPFGDVHLPGDQGIVDGVGGKLVGAGATVGLAGGQRNISHGDAVADDRFGLRGQRGKRRGKRRGSKKHRKTGAHELSSIGRGLELKMQGWCQNRHARSVCMRAHKVLCGQMPSPPESPSREFPLAQPLHTIA